MRAAGEAPVRLSQRAADEAAFWTPAQLVAHHTSGGCNLQPGDLFGSGTLSGPAPDQAGSLLELTHGGKQPLRLPNGETRTLPRGRRHADPARDLRARRCARIGFGECAGTVLPARIT